MIFTSIIICLGTYLHPIIYIIHFFDVMTNYLHGLICFAIFRCGFYEGFANKIIIIDTVTYRR